MIIIYDDVMIELEVGYFGLCRKNANFVLEKYFNKLIKLSDPKFGG